MKIEGKIVEGFFKERLNRFLALVEVECKAVLCFLPNPGRLRELLIQNVKVILKKVEKKGRKTSYDLIGVYKDKQKISIDSRIPNKLTFEALRKGDIREFSNYNYFKPEYAYGHLRFDFLLTNGFEKCLLEAKSCTLVKDGRALFPDAPTQRGRKHLKSLMDVLKNGFRACILFLVQRIDGKIFSPNDSTDEQFGNLLRQAAKAGVEVYAYTSEFTDKEIKFREKIEVDLNSQSK